MLSDDLQKLLVAAFAEEAERLLQDHDEQLKALREAKDGEERLAAVVSLRRTAHTLKGAARSTEFPEIESLAMTLEERYRDFERASDTPYLSPGSLAVLAEAGTTLNELVVAALSDGDELSGKGLFGLIERLEKLELSEPEADVAVLETGLPDTVRERLKFLTKTLLKLLSDKPNSLKIKKAQQIVSSLLGLLQEHRIEVMLELIGTLESVFREFQKSEGGQEDWPADQALLNALSSFRKDWNSVSQAEIDSALLGLRAWNFSTSSPDDKEVEVPEKSVEAVDPEPSDKPEAPGGPEISGEERVLRQAFRDEAMANLGELRDIIHQARRVGYLESGRLRIGIMALTGATRAVDLPLAESMCAVLETSLIRVADERRVPALLLERVLLVLAHLESDVAAYVEQSAPPESWRALLAIEKLESAVQGLVSVKLFEKEFAAELAAFRVWVKEDGRLRDGEGVSRCRQIEQLCRTTDMHLKAGWFERLATDLEAKLSGHGHATVKGQESLLSLLEFLGQPLTGTFSELDGRFEDLWELFVSSEVKPESVIEPEVSVEAKETAGLPAVVEPAAARMLDAADAPVTFWHGPSTEKLSVLASGMERSQELLSTLLPSLEALSELQKSEELAPEVKGELKSLGHELNQWHEFQTELSQGMLAQLGDCQEELRSHQSADSQLLKVLILEQWREQPLDGSRSLTAEVADFSWDRQIWKLGGLRDIVSCLRDDPILSGPGTANAVSLELERANELLELTFSAQVVDEGCAEKMLSEVKQRLTPVVGLTNSLGGTLRIGRSDDQLQIHLQVLADLRKNRAVFFRWNTWVFALPTLRVNGVERAQDEVRDLECLEFRGESWPIWQHSAQEVKTALFLEIGGKPQALLVGELLGEFSFVPRALDELIENPNLLPMSAGLLGEPRPILFLDPAGPFELQDF